MTERAIYETFNARLLEPAQVARTFVPPSYYGSLIRNNHTVVVGPRGSGKTTLLKMLDGRALASWTHPEADEVRAMIDYTGVFVPADRAWQSQLDHVGGAEFTDQHSSLLARAAFTTHVLRAVSDAMDERLLRDDDARSVHRPVRITVSQEADLATAISDAWKLAPRVPSFLGLKTALGNRLSEISALVSSEQVLGPEGRPERLAARVFLHLDFLAATGSAVDVFDHFDGQHRGKFAFLFDELDLAPSWVLDRLLSSLRSTDSRFLFKLSLTPFSRDMGSFDRASSPGEGHDFETISLWYPHKQQGYAFCESLLAGLLGEMEGDPPSPTKVFGSSVFETTRQSAHPSMASYAPGTKAHGRFVSLASKDASFRAYLEGRKIDLGRLNELEDNKRAAEIRKITALVATREVFRAPDDDPKQTRSRKNPGLYTGASAIFAMAEGNPRLFIGIVSELLSTTPRNRRIPPHLQSRAVDSAANKFRALLRTIPCPTMPGQHKPRGVLPLVDAIGKFLFHDAVLRDFRPDPLGSFTVDSHTTRQLENALADALNQGAIVYVPDGDSARILSSLKGKRFRLSYLLAQHHHLPLRLGDPIALSRMLLKGAADPGGQTELFEGGAHDH